MSLMRGKEARGPELLISADQCMAFVQRPDRGWTEVRRISDAPPPGGAAGGSALPSFASPAGAQMSRPPGFGGAGPLEEFASTARTLLRQVEESEAAVPNVAPSKSVSGAAPPYAPGLPCCTPSVGAPPGTIGLTRPAASPGTFTVP